MGRSEKKFNEDLILSYKETNDEKIFRQIIEDVDIKKYVLTACRQKLRHSPTTMLSLDDLTNVAFLTLWQSIHKFRFICSGCGIQAKSYSAYKLHTLVKHGQYMEPKVSISRFIKFNLGAYLQNEIKKEYVKERATNIMTINIFSLDDSDDVYDVYGSTPESAEFELVSNIHLEGEVVFKDISEKIMDSLEPVAARIFSLMYQKDYKQREIATLLYKEGRYSSEQSAAVIVSRIIKNKINPIIVSLYPELNG